MFGQQLRSFAKMSINAIGYQTVKLVSNSFGDPMQTDLKNGNRGAFSRLKQLFSGEDSKENGICTFEFGEEDIVRSDILKFIIKKINTLE